MKVKEKVGNFWNNLRLRHKILMIIIGITLIFMLFLKKYIPFIIVGDIIFIIGYILGNRFSCPKCKSYFARKRISTAHLSSRDGFKNIRRSTTHRDSRGNVIGSSSRRETVPIKLHTYQHTLKCKKCHHEWKESPFDMEHN